MPSLNTSYILAQTVLPMPPPVVPVPLTGREAFGAGRTDARFPSDSFTQAGNALGELLEAGYDALVEKFGQPSTAQGVEQVAPRLLRTAPSETKNGPSRTGNGTQTAPQNPPTTYPEPKLPPGRRSNAVVPFQKLRRQGGEPPKTPPGSGGGDDGNKNHTCELDVQAPRRTAFAVDATAIVRAKTNGEVDAKVPAHVSARLDAQPIQPAPGQTPQGKFSMNTGNGETMLDLQLRMPSAHGHSYKTTFTGAGHCVFDGRSMPATPIDGWGGQRKESIVRF